MADTLEVDAIGLQVCVYYCRAGFAVVVLFRRELLKSVTNFLFMGLWPFIGAVVVGYMFYESIPGLWDSDHASVYIGLGAMALGLIPMFYYWSKHVPYFTRPAKEDRVVVIQEFEQNR